MESETNNHAVATEEAEEQTERSARAPSEGLASIGDLIADRDRLAKEKNELQDLLQRRQAEFDNYRRRNERERGELAEYATMDALKALLPMLDDFERAIKTESTDRNYARGMELIYQRLGETLSKLGLEPVSSEVAVFNPHVHHAVEMIDTKDHPDQTILEEYQRGYYFKGRLLRPAMVKVAVNP
ncbi:MAG: nucleotide exchange factor GrpE [Acidobacteriota bacterium]|nr:nucleotide exchange factor GrpE [Acidobacteriota bacterium]